MIYHIIRKEILGNLLSLRFILSMLLIIVVFAVSGFVFIGRYRRESQEYWKTANENLAALKEKSNRLCNLPFHQHQIWRKPKPLTLCAGGFERYLPNYFLSDVFSIFLPEMKTRTNFLLPQFSDIDWVFIISILLSFTALLFTYDSICGERQAGTLRLILSGSIPRHKVLLGKYFGALFTLGIPLLVGLLINLVIVVSSGILEMGLSEWLKILIIILLSFLYLSIFLLLGIFVSGRTSNSAGSMVILLLIWVGLVVLIPSLGRIISDIYYKSPSYSDYYQSITESVGQVDHGARTGKYGRNAYEYYPDRNHPSNNPPAAARFWNELSGCKDRIRDRHHKLMLDQAFAGRKFACISPMVIYQRASEVIAGSGINQCADLHRQIRRYQAQLKEFILTEDRKDPDSLHLLFDFEPAVESWQAISKKPVDFNIVPKFQEKEFTIGKSLQSSIWDIGLLILFNLVFFAASFVSFLRYDVR